MLESLFNTVSEFIQSFLTFLKILIRSNLFLSRSFPSANHEACIILGNGPSLKKVLLNFSPHQLKKYQLVCVNKFPDTAYFRKYQPEYFVIASTQYFEKNTTDPNTAVRNNIIKALVQDTSWPLTMFCPVAAKKNREFVQRIESNPNIKIVFYNNTPVEGLPVFNRLFMKLGWGTPRPHNVLIPSILLGINMGFKKIYLVGADHSWIPLVSVNEKNEALVNQQHFYDADKSKSEKMLKAGTRPRRLHEILEKFMLSFRSYFVLKDYAESVGTEIYNCTPGSYIDAYERKELNEIL